MLRLLYFANLKDKVSSRYSEFLSITLSEFTKYETMVAYDYQAIDIADSSDIAEMYSVTSSPTIIVEKNGEEVTRHVGFIQDVFIRDFIREYIK